MNLEISDSQVTLETTPIIFFKDEYTIMANMASYLAETMDPSNEKEVRSFARTLLWLKNANDTLSLDACKCPECEGLGKVYICRDTCDDPEYLEMWEEAEKLGKSPNGWHSLTCLSCDGDGHLENQPEE